MNPGHFPFDKTVIQEMKDEDLTRQAVLRWNFLLQVSVMESVLIHRETAYTLPARDLVSSEVEMAAELNMLEGNGHYGHLR